MRQQLSSKCRRCKPLVLAERQEELQALDLDYQIAKSLRQLKLTPLDDYRHCGNGNGYRMYRC